MHWSHWRPTTLAPRFQKFYNSPTCSDVQIVLPACSVAGNVLLGCSGFHLMLPGDILVIHAHRFILAAGSEYFSRKLQEPEYMRDRVVVFHTDKEDGIAVMIDAIKHIYDLEFPRNNHRMSLYCTASIGAVAEKYGIAGLSESVLKAASRQLVNDLDGDEEDLEEQTEHFFGFGTVSEEFHDAGAPRTKISLTKPGHFAFAVRILRQDLATIRTLPIFQKLLKEVPQLAIDLFNLEAEEKDELEEQQKKIKDLR